MRTAVISVLLLFSNGIGAQVLESPCPKLLQYEEQIVDDRWTAVLEARSREGSEGVWLNIGLDYKADVLVTTFGPTTSLNNQNFQINNPEYTLLPGGVLKLRFTVKYNKEKDRPRVASVKLNGVEICDTSLGGNTISAKDNSDNQTAGPSAPPPTGKTLIRVTQTALCGMKAPARPLVYNGRKAEEQWPWHVAIMQLKNNKFDYHCGGTLISEKAILTAAHCVTILSTSKLIDKEMFILYMGITRLSDLGQYFKVRSVRNVFVHKEFNPQRYYNDLAIVDMSEPVEFNDYIQPICLWNGDLEIRKLVGEAGTVVGWGVDNSNQTASDLMEAKMPVVALETCLYHDPAFFSLFTTPKTYCAGGPNASAVCSGDSGGGMVFPRRADVGETVIWYLRGVVSVSRRDAGSVCNTKSYAVFSDVAQHLDWIKKTAGIS